jgi:hypothetical protein
LTCTEFLRLVGAHSNELRIRPHACDRYTAMNPPRDRPACAGWERLAGRASRPLTAGLRSGRYRCWCAGSAPARMSRRSGRGLSVRLPGSTARGTPGNEQKCDEQRGVDALARHELSGPPTGAAVEHSRITRVRRTARTSAI